MKSFAEFRRDALRHPALQHTEKASVYEDAVAMSVSSGAVAGLVGDPPVSKARQKKWIRNNSIIRRKT